MEKKKQPENESPSQRLNKPLKSYARYSTVAFKMIAVVLLGTYGGVKLDDVAAFKYPVFTLICALLSVALAMYVVIRDVSK